VTEKMTDSKKKKDGKDQASRHPWRDNIEAITMAIVMAVMLKYFIVEAYKIPTGSMQPTLMGNDETGIKDRILVDKFSYHFRDPERFEVTVFKYPLDLSKNFIKRLVGIGPEELKIEHGDLWSAPLGTEDWTILRRPSGVQEEVWKALYPGWKGSPGWKAVGGAKSWRIDEGSVEARGDGSLRYPPHGSIRDHYRDGYDLAVREKIIVRGKGNRHDVGDVRISGEIEALEGCTGITFELREGTRRYHFVLPGPAAPAEERLSVTAREVVSGTASPLGEGLEVHLDEEWKLSSGSAIDFGVQNMDDLLSLEIDGEILLELQIPPAADQSCVISVHMEGEGADIDDLMVYRDIYYTGDRVKRSEWTIPEGHYVMLGDNTQDSSDSREWGFVHYRYPAGDGELYRGNRRGDDNPLFFSPQSTGIRTMWLRDEFGELHTWPAAQAERVVPANLPVEVRDQGGFVPRELITGRAVVVFWPFKLSLRLWRLQWIR
jgi:signal peptidase I